MGTRSPLYRERARARGREQRARAQSLTASRPSPCSEGEREREKKAAGQGGQPTGDARKGRSALSRNAPRSYNGTRCARVPVRHASWQGGRQGDRPRPVRPQQRQREERAVCEGGSGSGSSGKGRPEGAWTAARKRTARRQRRWASEGGDAPHLLILTHRHASAGGAHA